LVPLLYNTWGGYILPEFVLGDIPHAALRSHETNYRYETLPGTGPWRIVDWDGTDHVTMEPNTHYWKTGFIPFETIDQVIVKIIMDDAAVDAALKAGDIAWGAWGIIDVPTWEDWRDPGHVDYQPYLTCFKYQTPCAHFLYLNLNNPILANRYVRQAIVHAIPYETIFGIVPAWGKTAEPMKSVIMPQQFYTEPNVPGSTTLTGSTVRLFNTEVPGYGYNLTKARYYMNLYLNQTSGDYGPVGDADQSGLVNFDDWWLWRANIPTAAADVPINIYPTWPFTIDPDYDNFQGVKAADQLIWSAHYGIEY
jgi:ABC-type transport system substrate-binding protein